jgi:hypothetical protein
VSRHQLLLCLFPKRPLRPWLLRLPLLHLWL